MLLFIEKGIRGGVSQCSSRYAKANNRYTGTDFNPSDPESYILYFDINNQYGTSMCEYLPYKDFEWIEDYSMIDFLNIPDDAEEGYILEIDLEYPEELHDLHKSLCPQHIVPPVAKCTIPKLVTNFDIRRKHVKDESL